MLLTRVGHAVAAGCFAATAMLLAVVLSQPARPALTTTGDKHAPALDVKLDAQMQRLHGVEQRMKDSEQTLERLETEISEATARHMGAAPEPPAPATVEEQPAPAAKPAPRSRTSAAAPKPVSTTKPVSTPKAATPRPADAKPPAPVERSVAVTPPPERVVAPPPTTPPVERAFAPKASDEPAASPRPSAASTPPVVSVSPTPPPAAPARAPAPRSTELPPGNDLRSKFRNDWQSIQRGWDRAADDFKRAVAPLRGD
jgi:hypothetical protein